ncbi:hypothetical protein M5689_000654 [Euphorbia peplus]|nr:hypothetical protein M5689_000654 [Euphorbia peplus]
MMRSNLSRVVTFIVMLAITLCFIQIEADGPSLQRYRYNVIFINGCESETNKAISGVCRTNTGGGMLHFYLPNLWQTYATTVRVIENFRATLDCVITRGGTQRESFRVFDQERDKGDHKCGSTGECWYKITENGIYFSNHNGAWFKIINW